MGDVFNAMARAKFEKQRAGSVAAADGAAPSQPPPALRHNPEGLVTDEYRSIRFQMLSRVRDRRVQTHLVVSADPGEGRTLAAVNLALAFSEMRNGRTLLVEADLRRPSFSQLFDRALEPGLVQLLRGEIKDIHAAIAPTAHAGLHVLPAGVSPGGRGVRRAEAATLLASPRMATLLERGKDLYDHVVIDCPPLSLFSDGCILAPMCDQALMVVRMGRTTSDAVERSKRLLAECRCEIAGAILTHHREAA